MGKSGEYGLIFFKKSMFIGEHQHNLDDKNRLAIPAKMRKRLGKEAVLTKGLDNCLFIYPLNVWEKLIKKLGELPMGQSGTRSFIRLVLSGASEISVDNLGRILIPDYLKQFAFLSKKVVIVGVYDRIEIWDTERWNSYRGSAEKNSEIIAEKLGELGVY